MNPFKIGHEGARSETFLPNVYKDVEKDIVFTDVAGLNDTGG